MIAIDADMGNAGGRDQFEHAFEQSVAGTQDRRETSFLPSRIGDCISVSGVSIVSIVNSRSRVTS